MISATESYQAAISGDMRQILLRAIVDISDPDITYGAVARSGAAAWSKPQQLYDKELNLDGRYATLEPGRWLLDGSFRLMPDDPTQLDGQIGHVGNVLSGDDGFFPEPVWVEETFSNVAVLQACSVYFSGENADGWPMDFKVEIFQGGTAYFTKEFTGNVERSVHMEGFTVNNPDKIRVTVTHWSLPGRRLRVAEIVPGYYELWDGGMVAELSVNQNGDVSCLSLPYGTCSLKLNNVERLFEPRNPASLFKSIEERQGITIRIGVRLPDKKVEYKQVGIFFQKGDGWKTSDNDMTIQWDLVDIIGLISERIFIPPDPLPTTLSGWLSAIVGHLGENFTGYYHADPNYADLSITSKSADDVRNKSCGDILRWVCQASGTWPRADAETGYLTAEPLWNQGNKILLTQILNYPTMKANDDIAMLIFYLSDGTEYVVFGTSVSSERSVVIRNPFIHTQEEALAAAKLILATYGGNKLETKGRGDPASEIGDVDTVWLDESNATTGRRIQQSFEMRDGVLENCLSVLLQADGSLMFEEYELITTSGTWKAPAGKTRLRIIVGQGGQGGGRGQDGFVSGSGSLPGQGVTSGEGNKGVDGTGGKIWYSTIDINPEQEFAVSIGTGGAPSGTVGIAGSMGGETTFGVYTSANGRVYPIGFTDIVTTRSFGRTGVEVPLPNSSDGGAGGAGGAAGDGYWKQNFWTQSDVDSGKHPGATTGPSGGNKPVSPGTPGSESIVGKPKGWDFIVTKDPGLGQPGKPGATGFVFVSWDKEE